LADAGKPVGGESDEEPVMQTDEVAAQSASRWRTWLPVSPATASVAWIAGIRHMELFGSALRITPAQA
jgi:hypothetical protein